MVATALGETAIPEIPDEFISGDDQCAVGHRVIAGGRVVETDVKGDVDRLGAAGLIELPLPNGADVFTVTHRERTTGQGKTSQCE